MRRVSRAETRSMVCSNMPAFSAGGFFADRFPWALIPAPRDISAISCAPSCQSGSRSRSSDCRIFISQIKHALVALEAALVAGIAASLRGRTPPAQDERLRVAVARLDLAGAVAQGSSQRNPKRGTARFFAQSNHGRDFPKTSAHRDYQTTRRCRLKD